MSFTKNYYHILGLPTPKPGAQFPASDSSLRKSYKLALLAAHPDKQTSSAVVSKHNTYSVDDVKEAYNVLGDLQKRREYNESLLRNPELLGEDASGNAGERNQNGDFVLGLELLDLSDFEVLDGDSKIEEYEAVMEWTKACRCGNDKGFRIREEELEDAEKRGEKEVLVGCEGCSLWARVGFDVEEG